jgi:hypothetical protein
MMVDPRAGRKAEPWAVQRAVRKAAMRAAQTAVTRCMCHIGVVSVVIQYNCVY